MQRCSGFPVEAQNGRNRNFLRSPLSLTQHGRSARYSSRAYRLVWYKQFLGVITMPKNIQNRHKNFPLLSRLFRMIKSLIFLETRLEYWTADVITTANEPKAFSCAVQTANVTILHSSAFVERVGLLLLALRVVI